jgi:hypothetical protein
MTMGVIPVNLCLVEILEAGVWQLDRVQGALGDQHTDTPTRQVEIRSGLFIIEEILCVRRRLRPHVGRLDDGCAGHTPILFWLARYDVFCGVL